MYQLNSLTLPTFPLLSPLVTLLTACLIIWLLHRLSSSRYFKPVLTKNVVEYVTAGILIYTLCVWVIGGIAVLSINGGR